MSFGGNVLVHFGGNVLVHCWCTIENVIFLFWCTMEKYTLLGLVLYEMGPGAVMSTIFFGEEKATY